MRLAWFRARAPERAHPLDATGDLIAELQSEHHITIVTESSAHDFVWKHFRAPFDLCVFELDQSAEDHFVPAYLIQYGGVLLLNSLTRDRAERTHENGWPLLRVAISAARVTVVPYHGLVAALQDEYPEARIRHIPAAVRVHEVQQVQKVRGAHVSFGLLATDRVELVERAVAHARAAGAGAVAIVDASPERLVRDADVIISMRCAARGEVDRLAVAALAAGTPLVTLETENTADWPALNPQTWRPRALATDPPVAVTVDVRDEEHSLALAVQRLASDGELRQRLSDAAHAWWRAHATMAHVVDAWREILRDALERGQPRRPGGWPPHLDADGTDRAREILAEFWVSVDLFNHEGHEDGFSHKGHEEH